MSGKTITYREAGKKWTLPSVLNFSLGLSNGLAFYDVLGYREPRAGEFYLSGARVAAYKAPNDFSTKYLVVKPTHKAISPQSYYEKGDPL